MKVPNNMKNGFSVGQPSFCGAGTSQSPITMGKWGISADDPSCILIASDPSDAGCLSFTTGGHKYFDRSGRLVMRRLICGNHADLLNTKNSRRKLCTELPQVTFRAMNEYVRIDRYIEHSERYTKVKFRIPHLLTCTVCTAASARLPQCVAPFFLRHRFHFKLV